MPSCPTRPARLHHQAVQVADQLARAGHRPPARRRATAPVGLHAATATAGRGTAGGTSQHAAYTLASHFQPIVSLTHSRVVGFESLLRARFTATGAPVPPAELFFGARTQRSVVALDRRATLQHLSAYRPDPTLAPSWWLFLNTHPLSFTLPGGLSADELMAALAENGLAPEQLVIEVLEAPSVDDAVIARRVDELKERGCLVALDDFGAGHSNFERVFRLKPEIVKLDKSVLARASSDERTRRITAQMVSLLHECGALVLMEGIETAADACTALACDADFAQGWFFGRPAATLVDVAGPAVTAAWDAFDASATAGDRAWRDALAPHCDALRHASDLLAGGRPLAEACAGFLALRGGDMCFLLDADGRQVGDIAFRDGFSHDALGQAPQFAPVRESRGARWSRRKYFRDAASQPGQVQLTRAYLTMQGGRMCATASVRFEASGETLTLCGDVCVG